MFIKLEETLKTTVSIIKRRLNNIYDIDPDIVMVKPYSPAFAKVSIADRYLFDLIQHEDSSPFLNLTILGLHEHTDEVIARAYGMHLCYGDPHQSHEPFGVYRGADEFIDHIRSVSPNLAVLQYLCLSSHVSPIIETVFGGQGDWATIETAK